MFKRGIRVGVIGAVLALAVPCLAMAETMQGRVVSAGRSGIEVTVYDAQGRPYPNNLQLIVDSRTDFYGVDSSAWLNGGDLVETRVSQQESGQWHADTVEKLQSAVQAPRPVARPSSSMQSSLTGQKVVRNALLGAGTGAIAASASGGKAGKGALIGAGVGVLGGWLADSMSQPQQDTQ